MNIQKVKQFGITQLEQNYKQIVHIERLDDSDENDSSQHYFCDSCGKNQIEQKQNFHHNNKCINRNSTILANQRKKIKKKNYKKRQQQKYRQQKCITQIMQEKAIKQLQQILKDVYMMSTNFEKQQDAIINYLEFQSNPSKFFGLIYYIIKQQVEKIKQAIKTILKQTFGKQIDYLIVYKLYEKFNCIKKASIQMQKIVNFFYCKYQINKQSLFCRFDQLSFNLILSNDEQLKDNLGTFCQNIILNEDKDHIKQKNMIEQIVQMLRNVQLDDDEIQFSDSEYSTTYSQESNFEQMKSQQKPKKKKKNKLKMEDLENSYESVFRRLQNFQLDNDARCNCNIGVQWIDKLQSEISSFH